MPRFLVQVSQPEDVSAKRIRESVSMIGSHFATHADWRRQHGVSTGTIVIDAGNRWHALRVVPPNMRPDARIFQLQPVATTFGGFSQSFESAHDHAVAA